MTPLIHCHQLSHQYGRHSALREVSFEVKPGAPVALVGPNGAGKSTLFSILCGYLQPTSGTVTLFGQAPGAPALAGRLGTLPQDALFDPDLTLGKQLVFLARLQGFSAAEALREMQRVTELMGLQDQRQAMPPQLSHGMRKRLSIAQALIGAPELVLLDEPTAGLDPENARAIRHCIQALAGQTTFMISSHNLDELERLCQQVLFLRAGELHLDQAIHQQIAGHISLRLWQAHPELAAEMQTLPGVSQVQVRADALLIDYDASQNPALDQQLLQLLAARQVRYRQLSHGQSLEEQLFRE